MGMTYVDLIGKRLLVVCEVEGELKEDTAPYTLIRRKDGTIVEIGTFYFGVESPGACLVGEEDVWEGDIVEVRGHDGKTRIYTIAKDKLLPLPPDLDPRTNAEAEL